MDAFRLPSHSAYWTNQLYDTLYDTQSEGVSDVPDGTQILPSFHCLGLINNMKSTLSEIILTDN